MNCRLTVFKAFSKSIFKILFSLSWVLSIREPKTCEANQRPFWCLHLLAGFRILPDVIRRHGIWRILRITGGKYCLQRLDEVLHRAILAQLVSHQRFTAESTFPSRITFTRFVRALRKFSPVCPLDLAVKMFNIRGTMPSNPALEPLEKDMRALWTKNSEVEKQSILVASSLEQDSLC